MYIWDSCIFMRLPGIYESPIGSGGAICAQKPRVLFLHLSVGDEVAGIWPCCSNGEYFTLEVTFPLILLHQFYLCGNFFAWYLVGELRFNGNMSSNIILFRGDCSWQLSTFWGQRSCIAVFRVTLLWYFREVLNNMFPPFGWRHC